MINRTDLVPGAYVADPKIHVLYEVTNTEARVTSLIDVKSPLENPRSIEMLTVNALRMLELVRPAPNVDDIADEGAWGRMGTAPE